MMQNRTINAMTYYRQHLDELKRSCRSLNAIQLVCLLTAAIGSGLFLAVKFLPWQVDSQPWAERLAALASHPVVDVGLIAIVGAFCFSARAYADAGRLLLVRNILEDEAQRR